MRCALPPDTLVDQSLNSALLSIPLVAVWYRVGGLDYLLRRTDIDQSDTEGG
jgi:hypothetical protein